MVGAVNSNSLHISQTSCWSKLAQGTKVVSRVALGVILTLSTLSIAYFCSQWVRDLFKVSAVETIAPNSSRLSTIVEESLSSHSSTQSSLLSSSSSSVHLSSSAVSSAAVSASITSPSSSSQSPASISRSVRINRRNYQGPPTSAIRTKSRGRGFNRLRSPDVSSIRTSLIKQLEVSRLFPNDAPHYDIRLMAPEVLSLIPIDKFKKLKGFPALLPGQVNAFLEGSIPSDAPVRISALSSAQLGEMIHFIKPEYLSLIPLDKFRDLNLNTLTCDQLNAFIEGNPKNIEGRMKELSTKQFLQIKHRIEAEWHSYRIEAEYSVVSSSQ